MNEFDKMTQGDFDRILGDIIQEEGRNLLLIRGVYEVVSEEFNNEVLDRYLSEQETEE